MKFLCDLIRGNSSRPSLSRLLLVATGLVSLLALAAVIWRVIYLPDPLFVSALASFAAILGAWGTLCGIIYGFAKIVDARKEGENADS